MNNLTSKKNDLTFHAMRQQVMKKMQKYGIETLKDLRNKLEALLQA